MCSTYCLSLDVRGGWVHAKRGSDAARHVWREIERGNSWQSTKLICWKISSVSKSNSGQVRGVHSAGNEAPNGNVERWLAAGLPLDRLLIKVLAHTDFILSWKVSKGPLVMPLILSPSSHIWRYHEGMRQPVDSTETPFPLFSDPCKQSA